MNPRPERPRGAITPASASSSADDVVGRVEGLLDETENRHQFHGTMCVCGYTSDRSRSRTEHITADLRAALHPEATS